MSSDIAEYQLLGTEFTVEEADANDARQAAIGFAQGFLGCGGIAGVPIPSGLPDPRWLVVARV